MTKQAGHPSDDVLEPLYIESRDTSFQLRLMDEECGLVDIFATERIAGIDDSAGGTFGIGQMEAIHEWSGRWLARQSRKNQDNGGR